MNFSVSFKPGFSGAKNVYLLVYGSAGNTGWQQLGTWTVGAPLPPTTGPVTPNSGSGLTQVFTAAYSDVQGYQDVSQAMFMVDDNASGVSGCVIMWDRVSNNFYLANDAATIWTGPVQAASNGNLQNSQCVLNSATSSGSGSGNALTVNLSLSLKVGFTGTKNLYMLVYGSAGNSGWQQGGTWTP